MNYPSHFTRHAVSRAQQRCIPPFIDNLLDQFGEEEFDGHGCIRTLLSRKSVSRIEKKKGKLYGNNIRRYTGVYKVESMEDGVVITIGWQYRRRPKR